MALCDWMAISTPGSLCSYSTKTSALGEPNFHGGRAIQWKVLDNSGFLASCRKFRIAAASGSGRDNGEKGHKVVAVLRNGGGSVGQQALVTGNWNSSGERSLALSGSRLARSSRRRRDGKLAVQRALAEEGETPAVSKLEAEASALADEWLEPSGAFSEWDATTARLADSATAAFLLLQLPQIILNTQNLLAGNSTALFAVPWMGQLTGLLGNLSLLSYFASKKERGAMVVQAVGVVSTLVVLSQLAIAGAMPTAAFTVTASAVGVGLVLNFLNYNNKVSPEIWRVWGEAVTIGGVTVLPQVMWSTFEPYLPQSTLPGTIFGILALTMIILARLGKLPPKAKNIIGAISAWTATLLFMWAPVAQWWQNYLYPANIKGLSVFTVLLAMVGNSLLLPRALFTRDLMWFTGSGWGTMFQGWGILVSMYMAQVIPDATFWGVTAALFLWLSTMLWKDSKAHELSSPLKPLVELVTGKKYL
ncbi:unnamed protein product [Calypogeia fissa]